MTYARHPKLPHLSDGHFFTTDLNLKGINRIQLFHVEKGKVTNLLWEFEHCADNGLKWVVVHDRYKELQAGTICNTGEVTKTLNYRLRRQKLKYVHVKLHVTDYIGHSLYNSVNRELLYTIEVLGKNRCNVIPLCDDTGYNCLGDIMPPRVKYERKGLHRRRRAKPPAVRYF